MKKNILTPSILFLLLGLIATQVISSSGGKSGRAGSPNEGTCSACHGGAGSGSFTLTSSDMTSWEYVPGQTYSITATVAEAGINRWGTCIEILNSSNANIGTFIITDATHTQMLTASNGRKCIAHKSGVSGIGTFAFNFQWKAPATASGNLKIYATGLAANGNNQDDSGDHTYSKVQVLTPAASTGLAVVADNSELLINVFPNPTIDELNIAYSVTKPTATVSVKLFDLQGKFINELMNAKKAEGDHLETFKLKNNFTSGAYILVINTGSKIVSKRLLIN